MMSIRLEPTLSLFFRRCKFACKDFYIASFAKSPLLSVLVFGGHLGVNAESPNGLFRLANRCSDLHGFIGG